MRAHQVYLDQAAKLLAAHALSQNDAIEAGAARIALCLTQGHRVYTFGTGHGHLLALEVFYRAGGPVNLCPILDERLMLHISATGSTAWERQEGIVEDLLETYPIQPGDVLIDISNSGRNAAPVCMAEAARARSAYVIALTNLAHSRQVDPRNSLGKRLFEVADLILDNGGTPGDACVRAKGGGMIGPTSTVVGAALLHAMMCRAEEIAAEQGQRIDFYASSNIDGGDEINQRYIDQYKGIIKGL